MRPAKQVLAIRSRVQNTDHWETVNARIKVETCERAADLLDPDRAELAAAVRRFGEADRLFEEHRYREAESRYRDARKTYLHVLGKDHPATALCSNDLAFCLDAQGKQDEAMGLYQEAIAIDLEKLGEDHPATAMCFNCIGESWNFRGKYPEAEPYLRRSLATIRRVLGDHHPKLATCCESLAYNLGERRRSMSRTTLSGSPGDPPPDEGGERSQHAGQLQQPGLQSRQSVQVLRGRASPAQSPGDLRAHARGGPSAESQLLRQSRSEPPFSGKTGRGRGLRC